MPVDFLRCACGCGGALHPVTPRVYPPAQRLIGPRVEPITLDEAKLHLKVEHTVDDTLIAGLISAARAYCEDYCERAIGEQSWRQTVDGPPSAWPIVLWRGPVSEIVSVTLVDAADSTPVDVVGCKLDRAVTPARVAPPASGWPPAGASPWVRTTVDYLAGAPATPEPIRQAMFLLVGEWYDSRAAINVGNIVTPLAFAVNALLAGSRTTTGVIVP